jgi:hypothetical protein
MEVFHQALFVSSLGKSERLGTLHDRFNPREKTSGSHCTRGWMHLKTRWGAVVGIKTSCPPPETELRISGVPACSLIHKLFQYYAALMLRTWKKKRFEAMKNGANRGRKKEIN